MKKFNFLVAFLDCVYYKVINNKNLELHGQNTCYLSTGSDFTYITWSISINNPILNCTFVDKMRNLFYFDL